MTPTELLADAGKANVVLLSRRELKRVVAPGDSLERILGEMMDANDNGAGPASQELFESATDLGHAPAWVDAGAVYEELLDQESPDYIFCLDPWAAQLLSRCGEAAPDAKWILVSDKGEDHPQYWEELDRWFGSLPWSTIVPRDLWDDAVERELVFLVRYSGSFPHLKVFLDSLARQHYAKDRISCLILSKDGGDDLQGYLRWLALAHPKIRVDRVADWESRLNDQLRQKPHATVVLVDDHAVLPEHFARDLGSSERATAFHSVLMSPEVTAHLLTGNLDPWESYDNLSGHNPGELSAENARVIPASAWRSGEREPSEQIVRLARESLPLQDVPRRTLIQLGDLP